MTIIELRRHSFNDPSEMLSPAGMTFAQIVGCFMHGERYTHVCFSHVGRTVQSAAFFAVGARDFPPASYNREEFLMTHCLPDWKEYLTAYDRLDLEHSFVRNEGLRMKCELEKCLAKINNLDAHLLAVGHSNLLEALIFAATGKKLRPLKECQGAIIGFNGQAFSFMKELRVPQDPKDLKLWVVQQYSQTLPLFRRIWPWCNIDKYLQLVERYKEQREEELAIERRAKAAAKQVKKDRQTRANHSPS